MLAPFLIALVAGFPPKASVRVEGEGYLRFLQAGRLVYAKQADLTVAEGRLAGGADLWISPTVVVPPTATRLDVEPDGRVFALVTGTRNPVGRLALALYPESAPKTRSGDLWTFQERPTLAFPGEGGAGRIVALRLASPSSERPADPAPRLAGSATVKVKDESASDGGPVKLGAIATLDGDPTLVAVLRDLELMDTPPFRTRATITRIGLEQKIRAAGVDPKRVVVQMGSSATVRRSSQILSPDRFIQAATQALEAQGAPLAALALQAPPPEMEAPTGDLRVETRVSTNGLAYGVTVAVWHGSNRIGGRDLRYEPMAAAIGVRIGETVQLVLTSAGARVACAAKATQDALLGGEATVRLETGKTHRGKVVARGVVEVTL